MAVVWTSARDSLSSALSSARGSDRAAVAELLARLTAAGAAYDAGTATGAYERASGSTLAAVWASRWSIAHAAALRGVRALETLVGGPLSPLGYESTGSMVEPTPARVVLATDGGAWPPAPAPGGGRDPVAPGPGVGPMVEVSAVAPGPWGNGLAVRVTAPPGGDGEAVATLAVLHEGAVLESAAVALGSQGLRYRGELVRLGSLSRRLRPWPATSTDLPLRGGAGATHEGLLWRCARGASRADRQNPAQALAADRVLALAADLRAVWALRGNGLRGDTPGEIAAELRLAALVEDSGRLLAYLAAA